MKNVFLASVVAFSLSACASGALTVEQPNASNYRTGSLSVLQGDSLVGVDDSDVVYTQRQLEEEFFGGDTPLFERGDGMTVQFRYVGFDDGSRVGRYLTGGLMGGSDIVLEVQFIDPNGEVLSVVRGRGEVSGGFFGGSSRSGIDKAVEEIAEYASVQFRN